MRATIRAGLGRYANLLRAPEPRILIGASSLSDIGDWLNIVATAVLAYQLGGDNLIAVGGLLALRKVPGLLLQIPAGALIDRVQGPGLLIASQILMAVLATSLVLLSVFPSLWLLYVLMVLFETGNVITFPAFRSAVARWITPEQRGAATALLSLEDSLASVVGPAVGGLILALSSVNVVFILNGLTYLVIAAAVARVSSRRRGVAAQLEDGLEDAESVDLSPAPISGWTGYGLLLRRPDVMGFCLMTLTGTLILQGAYSMFIIRAIDLGFGEDGIGVFYAAFAAGAILGGFTAGLGTHMTRSVLVLIGVMELANMVGFGLFAALPVPALVLLALVAVGVFSEFTETPALTYFQNTLPEEVFGRFFSIFMTAIRLGGFIGVLFVPWIGARTGYSNALLILVAFEAAIAIGYLAFARRWQQPIPPDAPVSNQIGPVSEAAT